MGTPDGSGYTGPLTWVEYARDGRHDRGHWEQFDVLTQMQMAALEPWRDSHVQIAHYGRELPFAVPKTYEREGHEQDPERLNKLDAIPHLANLIIDIDASELDVAREEAIKLVEWLGDADHYIYFSTRKGFHISIPWQILGVPKTGIAGLNWDTYSLMAQAIAEKVGLQHLDHGLYKKNGFIRAANTMHPNTGLYKVYITQDELKNGDLHELARAPRWDYPELDLTPSITLQSLYQRCQIKADRRRSEKGTSGSTAMPLDPEVLERLRNGVTPCLQAIPVMSTPGNRNNTAFRAVMMMKYQGYTYDEADTYLMDWLGNAYNEIGAKSTLDSAWNGPFAGGCQWMRDTGYATESDCSACPVGQKRAKGKPEQEEIADVLALPMIDNEIQNLRDEMTQAFDNLEPNGVYVVEATAGLGKSYAMMKKAIQDAETGGRVLIAVRDTKKHGGLAEEMLTGLRDMGFKGKVATLHGRNLNPEDPANARVGQNCDNWKVASRISKMGHGVSTAVCKTCEFRPTCGYYKQFSKAFEPGIYITSHAQLHHLTNGEHEAFQSRGLSPNQVGDDMGLKTTGTGSPLQMIVVDEDILPTWLEEFYIGPWNLKMELQQTDRRVRIPGKKGMTGNPVYREFELDKNWLRIIRWLDTITSSKGPVIHMLHRLAELEGLELQRILRTILPDRIGDPDPGLNEGHKPFTVKLYNALMADLRRMDDGNPLVHANGDGIIVHEITQVQLPEHVPLVILDAYARPERYKAFLKAAGIYRPVRFRKYIAKTPPNVTYVLGAALTTGIVRSAINGQSWAIKKIENVVDALKQLTSDGERTLLVAKRELLTSELLKNLLADSPHLIIEDEEVGTLHFWRGRGINGAAGERIAVIQDPNPPPEAVLIEASALHADEPKLDTTSVRSRYDVVWTHDAENPVGWSAPRWDYADERLNVIHRTLREDEVVQMALRGRSVTTGAEILLFTDYVDSRMPARRVYHLDKMEVELDEEDVRTLVYDYLMGVELLDADNAVKALAGKLPSKHQRALRRKLGAEAYSKLQPCDTEIIERELEEWKRM